jgi:hypothetical protein
MNQAVNATIVNQAIAATTKQDIDAAVNHAIDATMEQVIDVSMNQAIEATVAAHCITLSLWEYGAEVICYTIQRHNLSSKCISMCNR